jgi:hypothetical protein
MAARDAQAIALSVIIAAEVPNYYSGLLPSLFTIATFTGSDSEKASHTVRWIRRGEAQGTLQAVGLSVAAAILADDPWPFILSMAMVCYYLYQYEFALREGLRGGPGIDMDAQSDVSTP